MGNGNHEGDRNMATNDYLAAVERAKKVEARANEAIKGATERLARARAREDKWIEASERVEKKARAAELAAEKADLMAIKKIRGAEAKTSAAWSAVERCFRAIPTAR
jgi:lipopolysaccharide biosynthesis regulator YciM